ncbi:MAG: hypothetical protein JST01_04100 [Cyanobacteria bacterium SZAS TMP-1]|nr:hypothetical protein [Cyanobacteria bacterium SZAS TMP-1]
MTNLHRWLCDKPAATLDRLGRINRAATSSAHIILALSYGLTDPHIRAINKMIVALLLARHKAQRRGDTRKEQMIECKLQDLHEAINSATGTSMPVGDANAKIAAGNACKRATSV